MIVFGGNEGDIVCDPFCGIGTTLEVAAICDREYIGIELNREHVPTAMKAGLRGEKGWVKNEDESDEEIKKGMRGRSSA